MLPEYQKIETHNPQKMIIYSTPKTGKTSAISLLPNCLIIDLERGSHFVEGYKFDVKEYSEKTGIHPSKALADLGQEIGVANRELLDYKYDFIVIDTITALEGIATDLGTAMYKATTLGKNYKGNNVVLDLPNGSGYLWLRRAFEKLYGFFEGKAKYGLVLCGHTKASSILKDGKDLSANDLMLTGKLKQIITSDCDAIGLLHRKKSNPNQCILSFKTNMQDLATGARPEHLRNKEFVLTEMTDKGLKANWNLIYNLGE